MTVTQGDKKSGSPLLSPLLSQHHAYAHACSRMPIAPSVWCVSVMAHTRQAIATISITEVTPVGRQSDVDVTNAMVGRYDYACSGRERVRPCELNAEGTVERTACRPTGQGHKGGADLWV